MTALPPRPHALVGHTGFVGGNLARQHHFDAFFNSTNIQELAGSHPGLLVCAGAPGAKWRANAHAAEDRHAIDGLKRNIAAAAPGFVVLISTVDVFADPRAVTEESPAHLDGNHPYGSHRRDLEIFVERHFPHLIVRLPALFGPGLRKNAIHDLMHGHEVHRIDSRSRYQFYDISALWKHICIALSLELRHVHLVTEPVTIADVARRAFGMTFDNVVHDVPASYDVRTRHARHFGGEGEYLLPAATVLDGIADYVRTARSLPRSP